MRKIVSKIRFIFSKYFTIEENWRIFVYLKFFIRLIILRRKIKIYSFEKLKFNLNKKILQKEIKLNIIKPNFITKFEKKIFVSHPKKFPKIIQFTINHGKVYSRSNFIFKNKKAFHCNLFNPKNNFCLEEMQGRCLIPGRNKIVWFKEKKIKKVNEAISFLDSCSFNYAHWMLEIIPKIYLFSKFNKNKNIVMLIDNNLHKNFYEILNLIIKKNSRVIYVNKDECIYVNKLHIISSVGYSHHGPIIPSKKHKHGIYNHKVIKELSRFILNRIHKNLVNYNYKKIFLIRKTKKRNLINQKKLENILQRKGFKIIDINKLNFYEQVKIFRNASIIISVVGAINANLIFAKNNVKYFGLVRNINFGDGYYFWPSVVSFKNIIINFVVGKNIGLFNSTHSSFYIENFKIKKMLDIIERNY